MFTGSMLSTCIAISRFIVGVNIIVLFGFHINFIIKFYLIVFFFSGDIEVTVEFLIEMDKLVQLIESPIFACRPISNIINDIGMISN